MVCVWCVCVCLCVCMSVCCASLVLACDYLCLALLVCCWSGSTERYWIDNDVCTGQQNWLHDLLHLSSWKPEIKSIFFFPQMNPTNGQKSGQDAVKVLDPAARFWIKTPLAAVPLQDLSPGTFWRDQVCFHHRNRRRVFAEDIWSFLFPQTHSGFITSIVNYLPRRTIIAICNMYWPSLWIAFRASS